VRSQAGWGWRDLQAGHDAMVTAPGLLVDVLLELVR